MSNFPQLYSNPIGSPWDHPITFPITEVFAEFPGHVAQTNAANNEVGLLSLDRPYTLPIWSTPNTGQWEPTPYLITYSVQPPRCTDCGPHVTTPEPSLAWFLVAALILIMVGPRCLRLARKSIAKHKSRRMERRLNRQIAQWIRGGAR